MRYPAEHGDRTREHLLVAAAREFRRQGYAGVGVDGVAKAAGVTSGAFYRHFPRKADAFREIARDAVRRLRTRVQRSQRERPGNWVGAMADFYLSPAHRDDVPGGCGLPGLSSEVARAEPATREAYAQELDASLRAMADAGGLGQGDEARARAIVFVALLSGAVNIARAVPDGPLAAEILAAARAAVDRLAAEAGNGPASPAEPS